QRDPAGVPPHHLDDERAPVRLRRRVQAIDRLHGDVHRGVESEGVVGGAEVVVDRLRDADHLEPMLVELRRHAQRVLAADRDQRRDREVARVLLEQLAAALALGGVGAGRVEEGPAARQDPAYALHIERRAVAFERAPPAVTEPDEVVAVDRHTLAHHCPDHRVQSGAVAAARQHSNAHARLLVGSWSRPSAWPADRLRSTPGQPPTSVRASESTGAIIDWPTQAPSSAVVEQGAHRSALQRNDGGVRHARASFGTGAGAPAAHDTPPARTHFATARSRAAAARSATRFTVREHRSGTLAPAACTTSVATEAAAEPRHAPRSAAVAHAVHPRLTQEGAGGGAPHVRASLRGVAPGRRGVGQVGSHAATRRPAARTSPGAASASVCPHASGAAWPPWATRITAPSLKAT